MSTNPAHLYRDLARSLVKKLTDNVVKTIETGKSPDLYFSLERSLLEALKYADKLGAARERESLLKTLKEFDEDDGNANQ